MMLQSNFPDFVKQFEKNNPRKDFERNFLKIVSDIKGAIVGIKDVIVSSPQKASVSERAALAVKEIEKQQETTFEVEQDNFADIKSILNAIEVNTSKGTQQLISNENRDNFQSSDEKEEKDDKFIIDMEKKQFLMQKEQLELVKEIRDTLRPRVPAELTEHKSKGIDIFAALENDRNNNQSPLPDVFERNKRSPAIVTGTDGKIVKPKSTVAQKIGKTAKFGLGAAAVAGAGYFLYDTAKQFNHEVLDTKLKEVDAAVESGEISPADADKAKKEVVELHEKEMTRIITEEGGNLGGSIAGGFAGAKIGSFLGPLGTIGGGIVGSVAGSFAGTELGKKANEYFQENSFGTVVDDVKEKASNYVEDIKSSKMVEGIKDKFQSAKEYIQTDLFPEGTKKVENFITAVREGLDFDSVKKNAVDGLESIKKIIEPETLSQASKLIGEQPGRYVDNMTKMVEETGKTVADASKTFVNNIVNNQSTNTYIPMKATPRAEHTGSALDRYTDRLSMF